MLCPLQERSEGGEGLAATVGSVRHILARILSAGGAPNPVAHVLAARVEELGSSRRRDERIREHLVQVTLNALCPSRAVPPNVGLRACPAQSSPKALFCAMQMERPMPP